MRKSCVAIVITKLPPRLPGPSWVGRDGCGRLPVLVCEKPSFMVGASRSRRMYPFATALQSRCKNDCRLRQGWTRFEGKLVAVIGGSLLLLTSLIVRALHAGGAPRALGYAHSILGLRPATVAGLSGGYSVRICMCDSRIASMRVNSGGSVGSMSYCHSILAIRCANAVGLSSCYAI